MNTLQHLIDPRRLLLTWQPGEAAGVGRTRRVVAEVVREDDAFVLRYLPGTQDYDVAVSAGFTGHPAFPLSTVEHRSGVEEALSRRLPPRKREDFGDFLAKHRLPNPFPLSDLALLGYTGGALPSDGFALVPDFADDDVPCDYILEVAGVRHVRGTDVSSLTVGDPLTFVRDNENLVDRDALLVVHRGLPLGYVNRAMRQRVATWAESGHLSARIDRLNGKPGRPLVFARLEVA